MQVNFPPKLKFRTVLSIVLSFVCQGQPSSAELFASPAPPLAVEVSLVSPQSALTEEQIATLLPGYVQDPAGWAQDVTGAFHENRFQPSLTNVCMALAVIEQESSFQVNPRVPGLSAKVTQEFQHIATGILGPLGSLLLRWGLHVTVPGSHTTLAERLKALRTERDIDQMYQEFLRSFRATYPHLSAVIVPLVERVAGHSLEDFNPITTVGPMQVSIRFAETVATERGHDIRRVRDELYTPVVVSRMAFSGCWDIRRAIPPHITSSPTLMAVATPAVMRPYNSR